MSTQNQLTQLNFKYGKYSNKEKIENGTIGFASFEKDNTGTFIVKLNDKIYNTMPPSSTDKTLVGAPLVSGEANTSSYYAKTLSTYYGGTGLDKNTLKSHMLYFVPALDGIAQNKMIPMNSYIDEQCLTIGDINPNLYNSGLKADNVETLMTTIRSALFDFQDIACPMASIHYGGIDDAYLELPNVDGTLVATNFHAIKPIQNETRNLTAFSQEDWGALDQLDSLRYQSLIEMQGPYYYGTVNLLIGNSGVSSNSATHGNARGIITLYDNGKKYAQVFTRDALKGLIKFYLPDGISNEETEIYGVGFKKSIKNGESGIWGQGSSSLPVYVDASGEILPCNNSDLFSNLSWTAETVIGPTLSATIAGLTLSASIPVATKTQSGIITTTNQAFAGIKQFETLKTQSIYPLEKAKFNLGNSLTPWAQVSSQAYNLCGPVIYQDTSKSYAKTEYTLEQAQVQAQQECGKAYKIIQTEETETDYIITLQKTLETKGGDFWTNATEGDSVRATTLNLGNQASSNPSFNRYGILTIYDQNNCWASVRTRNYMNRNSIFYLPDGASDTYAVWSAATTTDGIIDQTTGDTDIPVYVNNKGQLVACADNSINIYAHATAPNENGEITNYKCKAASLIADNKDTLDPRPVLLTLGTKTNESGNRYGQIRLHSQAVPTSGSVTIETRSRLTKDITFFLPEEGTTAAENNDYENCAYAVWTSKNKQNSINCGDASHPIYINNQGKAVVCGPNLGSNIKPWQEIYANKIIFYDNGADGHTYQSESGFIESSQNVQEGITLLSLGNDNVTDTEIVEGSSEAYTNKKGQIRLYTNGAYCINILPRSVTEITHDTNFFLPKSETNINDCYAVWYENAVVGSTTQPVYIDAYGKICAADSYSSLFTNLSSNGNTLTVKIGGRERTTNLVTSISGSWSKVEGKPDDATITISVNGESTKITPLVAGDSSAGIVTTSAQVLAGSKTFRNDIILQSKANGYTTTIKRRDPNNTAMSNINFYLPPGYTETKTEGGTTTTNYITDCYAVWIDKKQTTIGSAETPVYIDGTGKVKEGYRYAGGTLVTLNGYEKKATGTAFYAPLSGGSVAEGSDTQVLIAQGDKKAPIWMNETDLCIGFDKNGDPITETYETKSDATSKLAEAKTYADGIKSALLGTGTISKTYDTLKEIADWITDSGVDTADLTSAIAEETKNRAAAISSLKAKANNGISVSGSLSADGGLTISGVAASDKVPGIVTIGNQTFAGAKTFNGAIALSSTLSVDGTTTLSSTLSVDGATTLSDTLSVTGATTIGVENGNTSLIVHGTATIKGVATLGTDYVDTITLQGKTVLTKDVQYGEKAPSTNTNLTNPVPGQIYFQII